MSKFLCSPTGVSELFEDWKTMAERVGIKTMEVIDGNEGFYGKKLSISRREGV